MGTKWVYDGNGDRYKAPKDIERTDWFEKPAFYPNGDSSYPHVHIHPDSVNNGAYSLSHVNTDGSIGHFNEYQTIAISTIAAEVNRSNEADSST